MIRIIFIAIIVTAAPATAQQAMPLPKVGPCPSGYTESGGFCAPTSDRAPVAIPKPRGVTGYLGRAIAPGRGVEAGAGSLGAVRGAPKPFAVPPDVSPGSGFLP
jgi:hypothetical protein